MRRRNSDDEGITADYEAGKGKVLNAGVEIAVPGGFWSEINKPFRPEESTMNAWDNKVAGKSCLYDIVSLFPQ